MEFAQRFSALVGFVPVCCPLHDSCLHTASAVTATLVAETVVLMPAVQHAGGLLAGMPFDLNNLVSQECEKSNHELCPLDIMQGNMLADYWLSVRCGAGLCDIGASVALHDVAAKVGGSSW